MPEDKIKLGYFVATPELRIDEKVTAYQGDMEAAFHTLSELGYDGAELMILDLDFVDRDRVEQLSREYDIEIPVLCTGEVYGQGGLSFMNPDQSTRTQAILRMKKIIDRGNLDFGKILSMLKAIGYSGYISAEINQYPDQDIVIEETINALRPFL
ncbi:MAG: hypothetical protein PVF56_20370 [Desulfobacterales bacterium]|jgi:sugar phosphate isomerase/epimerase